MSDVIFQTNHSAHVLHHSQTGSSGDIDSDGPAIPQVQHPVSTEILKMHGIMRLLLIPAQRA